MSDGLPFFPEDERCPGCGLDPCGCGVDLPAGDDPDVDFRNIEAVAAIVRATPIAATRAAELLAPWSSPAFAAFIDRRAALQAKHGERACTDPTRPPSLIAHDLKDRGSALVDRLSGRATREQLEIALRTAATAGALAMTLYDRLAADLAGEMP